MKNTLFILFLSVLFIVGCTNYVDSGNGGKSLNTQVNSHSYDLNTLPIEELSEAEINALNLTLNDEYRAEAIYQNVLDKFGDVRPFSNIIRAEQKHSDSLIQIYERYGLIVPENNWYDSVPEFDSVREACAAGVEAEIENAALYDELMSNIDNQDIIIVFTALRDASINNHLPAFQRCSK